MMDEADVFSITTTTTCAKAGTPAACTIGAVVVAADGTAVMRPAESSTTEARARRPSFMAALFLGGDRETDDEAVNFLVGQGYFWAARELKLSSGHGHRDAGERIDGFRASGVFDPDAEVNRAGGGAGAVPVIGRAGRVTLHQLPAALRGRAHPELVARVGARAPRSGAGDGDVRPGPVRHGGRRGRWGHRRAGGRRDGELDAGAGVERVD